jgi:transcriptional regulator with GAF, ATPase, and Fis domain
MGDRITHLQDARILTVQPLVTARVRELAALAGAGAFEEFFDSVMRALLLENFRAIGAHEGTVWLLDQSRSFLVPRFNSGPNAANFVGSYRHSLRSGMISMVVSTEQPICENEVHKNQQQDKTLDRELGLTTCAMLATPLYFGGELRGVISAVQLKCPGSNQPEPPGFTPQHLEALQLAAAVLARLVEQELYAIALGVEQFA